MRLWSNWNALTLLRKWIIHLIYDPAILLLIIYPRERRTYFYKDLHNNVYNSFIYNSQNLDTAQMSITRRMDIRSPLEGEALDLLPLSPVIRKGESFPKTSQQISPYLSLSWTSLTRPAIPTRELGKWLISWVHCQVPCPPSFGSLAKRWDGYWEVH